MVATGPIPGQWSRSSGGAPAHGRRPERGTAILFRREPSSRRPDSRLARSGGRVALAAVFIAATLLSPGARDACAGCCRDEAPAVAAPLAAGIAPVHACCQVPAPERSQGCCGAHRKGDPCQERASTSGSSAERSACQCHVGSDEGLPADTSRRGLGQRPLDGASGPPHVACPSPTAPEGLRSTLTVMMRPPPGRPARILYGVWRN